MTYSNVDHQQMSLKELIDNCGFHFRSLSLHTPKGPNSYPRWIVRGGIKKFGKWRLFGSSTPEHAVYKLLQALNEAS